MNVQDIILENLLNENHLVDLSDFGGGKKPTFVYRHQTTGTQIPLRQSQVLVFCSINPNYPLFLQSFDIPAIGMSFSNAGEHLCFVEPKVNMPSASFTGFIHSSLAKTLWAAYNSQFEHGLLSLRARPSFKFSLYHFLEDYSMSTASMAAGAAASSVALTAITKSPLSLLTMAPEAVDVIEDADIFIKTALQRTQAQGGTTIDLIQLKNCYISAPKITTNPASNEWMLCQVNVDYTNYRVF